jgi:arylsulfatase A-like enzyme
MAADRGEPRFLFLHYWHTHAPYGASDNLAHGQTLELLRRGELPAVRSQYEAAVQRVFEYSVARVLENLDLKRWCVLIFGDHGESWTRDEPYHGLTLRNSVLRVPLYFHIPNSGNPRPPRQLLSIVDLFPTLIDLFQLPIQYRGFGRDLRQEQSPDYYAAQIDPVANEVAGEDDPGRLLVGGGGRGRQWALFNPQVKMTYFEESKQTCLERTFDEQPIADGKLLLQMQEVYRDMNRDSAYADQTSPTSTEDEESMLEQRLRDLGYLA